MRNDRNILLTYLPTNLLTCKRVAFTLAEMMVVLLIMTIVLAAAAPVMTTRHSRDNSQPWKWISANSAHAYFGNIDSQIALVGKNTPPNTVEQGAKLVINTGLDDHILFESGGVILGRLRYQNNGILLGNLQADTGLGNESIALGKEIVAGTRNVTIGNKAINNGENGILISNAWLDGKGTSEIAENSAQPIGIGHMVKVTGSNTVAIGTEANAFGSGTIAIGSAATTKPTQVNPTNSGATAIGSGAKAYALNSIAIGNATVNNNTNAADAATVRNAAIAIGDQAEADYDFSIAIGRSASAKSNRAIAIGRSVSVPASRTVAIGSDINSKGTRNVLIGTPSEADFESDYCTTAGWEGTGGHLDSGRNVFIGEGNLFYGEYTTASNNVALGFQALPNLTTGNNNIAIGKGAMHENTTGGGNIAIGPNTLYSNYTGTSNIAMGNRALETNTVGTSNIAIGVKSLLNSIGNGNVALGENACQNVTGSNKVCIGTNSGPASESTEATDDVERIFIGSTPKSFARHLGVGTEDHDISKNAVVEIVNREGENWLPLGDDGRKSKRANYIDGPTVYINGNLVVRGYVWAYIADNRADEEDTFSLLQVDKATAGDQQIKANSDIRKSPSVSDRRLKNVGKEFTSGLDKIRELKPFHYTFKKDEKKTPRVGVMAQDLQKVFPDAVSEGGDGFLRIRMEDMFYAVINAIKELDAKVTELMKLQNRIDILEKQNAELKKTNTEILKRLNALERKVK